MCPFKALFDTGTDETDQVRVSIERSREYSWTRFNHLKMCRSKGLHNVRLTGVRHIPDMGINLFSLERAQLTGHRIKTHSKGIYILKVVVSDLINPINAITIVQLADMDTNISSHVDMDLVQSNDPALGGRHFALICKDRFSGYSYVFLMKTRNEEACEKLQALFSMFESESGQTIKPIRTDNGSEFIGERARPLCAVEHCVLDFSAPRCPEQNGVAERNNRTLVETARTIKSADPHLHHGL